MTKNEITIEDIKFEAGKINDDLDAFREACQQEEEAYGNHNEAVNAKRNYKRSILDQWNQVRELILTLDIHSK